MLKAVETAKNHAIEAVVIEKEIPMQPVSLDIWDKKYCLKTKTGELVDKNMDDSYSRVARALADVEEAPKREEWHEKFLWALRRGAIPAGRITSNAGALEHKPATSTINCTVSGVIDDSMDNILGKVQTEASRPGALASRHRHGRRSRRDRAGPWRELQAL